MNAIRITLTLLLAAGLVNAATYPILREVWVINLGGDRLDIRDVDGDGRLDIMIGFFKNEGSYVYLLDNNGILQWRNKISVIWPNNTPHTVTVDDIDANNNTDIVVGSVIEAKTCAAGLSEYNQPIFVLERNPLLQDNMLKWRHLGYGLSISIYVADINGDKQKEVISGAREGIVYTINSDGTLRWKYETEGSVNAVYAADLNGDGTSEILAGSYKYLHVTNNLGNRIWRFDTGGQVTAVYAADINNDGQKEALAITENDTIFAISAGGNKLWEYHLLAVKPIVTAADIDADGYGEVMIASSKTIYALDYTGKLKWTYETTYPIVDMKTGQLQETNENLVILGARQITTYKINADYLNNLKAQYNLKKSTEYLANNSFEKAQQHAELAYELYSQLNDTTSKENALKINESSVLQVTAAALYKEAQEAYTSGDYQTSKEKAIEAEKLYSKIKDENRTNQALTLVNKAIDQIDAEYFYQRALGYYRSENYLEGIVYSKKALDIYLQLKDTTNINKAEKLFNNTEEYPKANKNYEEAIRQYEKQNYNQAATAAQQAKNSYEKVGDKSRVTSIESIISKINREIEKIEHKAKGDEYYDRANSKLNTTNYPGCIEDATTSQTLYANATDTQGETKARNLITLCEIGVEAQKHYAKANELYTNQQYEAAKDYAEKARKLYRGIDQTDAALQTTDLILEIEAEQKNKQQTIPKQQDNTLPTAAAAVAALIVAASAYLLIKKFKKPKPKKEEPEEDYPNLPPKILEEKPPQI
ncbi:MAG: FG-GAP-like repeat-containing protein [Candidatus Altiarchaeota archaeon]